MSKGKRRVLSTNVFIDHRPISRSEDACTLLKACFVAKKASQGMPFLLVGVTGLEPAASWSRTKRTTKLCNTPQRLLL